MPSPNCSMAGKPLDVSREIGAVHGELNFVELAFRRGRRRLQAREAVQARDFAQPMHLAVAALIGIAPKGELEGMMAAQLIAAHNAAMECYRRAMIGEQTFEGRRENLAQANKLSRTYATLLDALNHHRGKVNRRSRSNMSMCTLARRRWSAWSAPRGVGIARNWRNNPMQSELPMHLSPRCRARTRAGTQCRSPAMANGRCRMHGGLSPGAPKGNSRALRHGRYTAEAVAERRQFAALLRDMRGLVEQVEGDE